MRKIAIITLILITVLVLFLIMKKNSIKIEPVANQGQSVISNMKISSSAFQNNDSIPSKYTCDGSDIIPPLNFSDIPAGTKSLTLIMDDPDAPSGTWDHWIVFNMSPDTKEIKEGIEPVGLHGLTSSKELLYGGPCPPDKEHRYFFKLYALDTVLNLSEGSTKREIESSMQGHIIEQAELMGKYNRK